ncbi:carbohydrate kinase family protein [Candidatus Woesearchaeota archaeon]|nr:carbohydrate kinase family protein [Candidatus Woesearchaeota archaeon]
MTETTLFEKKTVVVGGSATLDSLIQGIVRVNGPRITIEYDNAIEHFDVEDPPIRAGHKHRVSQDIGERTRGLLHRIKPGGGGYNSVTALRRLSSTAELDLDYVDVSVQDSLVVEGLERYGINYHFFGLRPVPTNAVIGSREDKIVLKGPKLGRIELDAGHRLLIYGLTNSSDAVFLNSAKDKGFVECFLDNDKPAYFVVTTSLEPDFVVEKMLPRGVCIMNYDDISALFGTDTSAYDDKAKMEMAFEMIKRIRIDGINPDRNLYVTLGKNGVYCSYGPGSLFHVRLSDEFIEKVRQTAMANPSSTNGAGDVFAAAVLYNELCAKGRFKVTDVSKKASAAAVRHIGYGEPLPDSAFIVNRYSLDSGSRKAA